MPFACSVAVAKQRGCCGNFMAVLGRRGFVASVRLHEVRGFSKHHLTPRAWILLPPRVTKISYGDYGEKSGEFKSYIRYVIYPNRTSIRCGPHRNRPSEFVPTSI